MPLSLLDCHNMRFIKAVDVVGNMMKTLELLVDDPLGKFFELGELKNALYPPNPDAFETWSEASCPDIDGADPQPLVAERCDKSRSIRYSHEAS